MKQENRMLGGPGQPPRAEKSLKEEFAEREAELTPEELALFKRRKEELTAQWLLVGGFWGCVLGALIGHFLLDTSWLTGIYTGLPLGLLAGLAAGQIFGGLEKPSCWSTSAATPGRTRPPPPKKTKTNKRTAPQAALACVVRFFLVRERAYCSVLSSSSIWRSTLPSLFSTRLTRLMMLEAPVRSMISV